MTRIDELVSELEDFVRAIIGEDEDSSVESAMHLIHCRESLVRKMRDTLAEKTEVG